jgi:hypothetical protein
MIIAIITAVMFVFRKFWTWLKKRRAEKDKDTLLVLILGLLNKADLNLVDKIINEDYSEYWAILL